MMLEKTRSRRLVPKEGRVRDRAHMARLAGLACSVPGCKTRSIQVHHLTCGPEAKARGLKAGDCWTVPVCVRHHGELHGRGDEREWWAALGIDPIALAGALWAESRGG